MSIKILSSNIINQIAAGEVIERPASVIKELVENALDAKATQIEVAITDGGKTLISVVDNGGGMSKEELNLAVERHATSKLPDDDLFNICYFGFRGEALPSIASVSRLCITSRQENSENAWKIEVEGGEKGEVMPAAYSKGTRIEVRDLFFATPARLKFLKTSQGEAGACQDVIERIALANPDVCFSYYVDGKRKLFYPTGNRDFFESRLERLSAVMGKEFRENSVLIDTHRDDVKISGYVSLPTLNKANSLSQFLFVNNRPVRDKLLLGAIRGAYQDVVASRRYPMCALFFDINPEMVDVNVHPTKAEVRFYNSGLVRGLLVSAIRNALMRSSGMTTNTLDVTKFAHLENEEVKNTDMMMLNEDMISFPEVKNNFSGASYGFNPNRNHEFHNFASVMPHASKQVELPELESKFSVRNEDESTAMAEYKYQAEEESGRLGMAKAQFNDTYIVAQTEDSMIIVDQHAAHERIVMEKLKESLVNGQMASQILLIPEVVELNTSEKARILEASEELAKMGLKIEEFGISDIIVREIPAIMGEVNIQKMIRDLAEQMMEWGNAFNLKEKIHLICATIACHGSIRAGRVLNISEMNHILRDMEKTPHSGQCNHGRPTYIELKMSDIAGLFDRK